MVHRRKRGCAVADAGQVRDADAQVPVRAARQRLVEQACFEQDAQPADDIAGLDAGVPGQEVRRVEPFRRKYRFRLLAFLDPQKRRRDQVEITLPGKREAGLQVAGLPPIVIVEDRDIHPGRISAGA